MGVPGDTGYPANRRKALQAVRAVAAGPEVFQFETIDDRVSGLSEAMIDGGQPGKPICANLIPPQPITWAANPCHAWVRPPPLGGVAATVTPVCERACELTRSTRPMHLRSLGRRGPQAPDHPRAAGPVLAQSTLGRVHHS